MHKSFVFLFIFLLLLVQFIPMKESTALAPVYVDPANDVYITDSVDYYYANSNKTTKAPYIDIQNITIDYPNYLHIFVKGGLDTLGEKSVFYSVVMVINSNDSIVMNATGYGGGAEARLTYLTLGEVVWYQGLTIENPSDNELVFGHTDRLQLPYNISARAIQILNNGSQLIPPFYVDFYPNAAFLYRPPPTTTTTTTTVPVISNTLIIALVVVIGGGTGVIIFVLYYTSCGRKWNKGKPKCMTEIPKVQK